MSDHVTNHMQLNCTNENDPIDWDNLVNNEDPLLDDDIQWYLDNVGLFDELDNSHGHSIDFDQLAGGTAPEHGLDNLQGYCASDNIPWHDWMELDALAGVDVAARVDDW